MNLYVLWVRRVLFSSNMIFQLSTLFSLIGLVLAVASLTVAVLAVNGFSQGLERALVDKQGHIRIQRESNISSEILVEKITNYKALIQDQALFLSFPALILKDKKFKGIFFEGIEDEKLQTLPFFKNRILKGDLNQKNFRFVIVGHSLAQELNLDIGSDIVILVSDFGDSYLSRKQKTFKVAAIADFGRYDFNSRFVVTPLSAAQLIKENQVSGMSLWLKNKKKVDLLKFKLQKNLGELYTVNSWKDIDKTFFKIIESDKKIIFFVLFILIVAAGFNISSSLFVQVFRKTKDISILKAMGAKKQMIRNLFLLNGLILGLVGTGLGMLLGVMFCYGLIFLQNTWHFIPEQVYQVNQIVLDWKNIDLVFIFIFTLIIVLLSSFFPARRAYKMSVNLGLSHN